MGEGSNPVGALLGFWMLMQLVTVLLTLIGGLYALWCLNRIASSNEQNSATLERLTVATERLTQQNSPAAPAQNVSPAQPLFPAPVTPMSVPQTPVAPQPPVAPVEPVAFTLGTSTPQISATPQSPTEENRPL